MSNCNECVCEQVCKYNDGVNLWCKKDCPRFVNKNYFPCKIGQRVFVIDTLDSENCEYIVAPCTVNCIIVTADNVQLKCNETSNHLWHWKKDVFATAEKAEESKNQLVKQVTEGAKQNV